MSNISRSFAVCLLLLPFPFGSGQAEHAETPPPSVQKHLEVMEGPAARAIDARLSAMTKDGLGAAVIAAKDGDIILDAGYGYAIRETDVPFTTETVAQIGSLTKQFTAMAVIDLAMKGHLDFDQPVSTYLPGASHPASRATLQQLLTHTSGMPEYCGRDFDIVTKDDLLQDCMGQSLRFEPGTDTAYSNPGFSVLAAVVEAVSGQSLEDYLQDNILTPNGLENTGYAFPENIPVAHGYLNGRDMGAISDKIAEMDGDYWALKGNGGMQATARDMYRWYNALAGEGALSPQHIGLAVAPHGVNGAGNYESYGWNIGVNDVEEITRISHAGSDGVFFSYFWWRPQERVFYYIVGNSGEAQVLEAVRAVRDELRKAYVSAD